MNLLKNKKTVMYLLSIIFFAVFYLFLPFAGDDWAWGSDIGLKRLENGFAGYNGRYIGNLLIILITRSLAARVAVCTLFMFLLIYILSKIFDDLTNSKNSNTNFIIAFSSVLILVLPNQIAFGDLQPFQIFGSTIGWFSGFTNYVVPSVFILIFYYIAVKKETESVATDIFLIFDGLIACLCVEHYTLFCLIFSFFVIAYRYYFYKKICKKSICFFLGSLSGALIMFSNNSYMLMQKGDISENQRAVGFLGSLRQYANYIFPQSTNKIIVYVFEIVLLTAIFSFLIYFSVKVYKTAVGGNIRTLLPMVCLVVMTLPLLFTNSGKEIYVVAPRCYFLQYFMFIIYIYGMLVKKGKILKMSDSKSFKKGIKVVFTILIFTTAVIYGHLDYMGIVRDNTVDKALLENSSAVEIIKYPESTEHIQWSGNFIENEVYLNRYKKFKNIPDDKEIIITQY